MLHLTFRGVFRLGNKLNFQLSFHSTGIQSNSLCSTFLNFPSFRKLKFESLDQRAGGSGVNGKGEFVSSDCGVGVKGIYVQEK